MARSILVSGACGAGKSTLLRLGYRALFARFGRTAALDTDWFFTFVDPHWELPYEERDGALMFRQCGLLSNSFLEAAFDTVLIAGNALHTRGGMFDELVETLRSRGDVFHFTLDPSLEEIMRRVAERGGDKTPEWLTTHVRWMRDRYEDWTCLIDSTAMTPEQTVDTIAAELAAGRGLLAAAT